MSKVHICDVCGKVITEWERVTYIENYIGCCHEDFGTFPSFDKRRVEVEMCKPCHDALMQLLIELAGGVTKSSEKPVATRFKEWLSGRRKNG